MIAAVSRSTGEYLPWSQVDDGGNEYYNVLFTRDKNNYTYELVDQSWLLYDPESVATDWWTTRDDMNSSINLTLVITDSDGEVVSYSPSVTMDIDIGLCRNGYGVSSYSNTYSWKFDEYNTTDTIEYDYDSCAKCTYGSYSIYESNNSCSECPSGVECYGSSTVKIVKGYWSRAYTTSYAIWVKKITFGIIKVIIFLNM